MLKEIILPLDKVHEPPERSFLFHPRYESHEATSVLCVWHKRSRKTKDMKVKYLHIMQLTANSTNFNIMQD